MVVNLIDYEKMQYFKVGTFLSISVRHDKVLAVYSYEISCYDGKYIFFRMYLMYFHLLSLRMKKTFYDCFIFNLICIEFPSNTSVRH